MSKSAQPQQQTILMVDDTPANLGALAHVLEAQWPSHKTAKKDSRAPEAFAPVCDATARPGKTGYCGRKCRCGNDSRHLFKTRASSWNTG